MIGIVNVVVVVEKNYIHLLLVVVVVAVVGGKRMIMNIEFDKVVEHYSLMMMLVHANYFDVVTEENLLVVIQTIIEYEINLLKNPNRNFLLHFSQFVFEKMMLMLMP